MMALWSWLVGRDKRSAQLAKQRLQALLEQERAARGQRSRPDYLPALQRDLMGVVSKYVKVPHKHVRMQLQRRQHGEVLEVKIELPQAAR